MKQSQPASYKSKINYSSAGIQVDIAQSIDGIL
jgi:hypothetical protein